MQVNRASIDYHLKELEIAEAQGDIRKSLPDIPAMCHRLLDVGCGIGQSLIALRLPATVEAHGVDIDEEAVAFGSARNPHLHLRAGSGEKLPYTDEYFDMVMCRVSLPYMHIPTALREFHRVLRPDGGLWVTVHSLEMFRRDIALAIRSASARGTAYRLYALCNTALLFAGHQLRFPLNRARVESYQPEVVIRRQLRMAGFRDIRVELRDGQTIVTATRGAR
jgi:ubiquinone/menaquinone biosynthesis C-methylase UbiE